MFIAKEKTEKEKEKEKEKKDAKMVDINDIGAIIMQTLAAFGKKLDPKLVDILWTLQHLKAPSNTISPIKPSLGLVSPLAIDKGKCVKLTIDKGK